MPLSWNQQVERLVRVIETKARTLTRPCFVAIDGRSGSGKSTLAGKLEQTLGCLVISGDDFFAGGETVSILSPQELAQACIDWKAQRRVLESLHRSAPTQYFPYDWDAFDGSRTSTPKHLDVRRIVVVEGVYSARPELGDLVDLRVLVEVPVAVRHQRLVEREGQIGAWEEQWHRAEDWYFRMAAPRGGFDIVLSETSPVPS